MSLPFDVPATYRGIFVKIKPGFLIFTRFKNPLKEFLSKINSLCEMSY